MDDVKEGHSCSNMLLSCRYRFCFCGRPKLSGLCLLACCLLCTRCRYSVVDEVISDVLCPSVVVDGEDGDVAVADNVVSSVEPLSSVDDSNVDVLVGVITVVNVD